MNEQYGLTAENFMCTLPIALRHDPKMIALGKAVADVLAKRQAELEPLNIYGHIEDLPEEMLDILASDFKVDWYDCDYPLEAKRKLLVTERYIHRRLGTTGAIRRFVQAIYPGADIEEWFSYNGEPHHFRLTLNIFEILSLEALERIIRAIQIVKRLSSWLDDITINMRPVISSIHIGGGLGADANLGIHELPDDISFNSTLHAGGGAGTQSKWPIPENRTAPAATTILRAGGVTTILSNISKGD